MFFTYKSVIVTPCACDLFVSKVTKITRYTDVHFWWSFFGAFSVCDDCILKSTTAWLLKLSVLYIQSFMHIHNTTFQIKTVFNNVLFLTEVHNHLHAHLLALSHIYIYILYVCMYVCVYIYLYIYIYAYYHYCFNYYYHYYFLFRVFSYLVANYQEPIIVHNSATTTTHSDINTNLNTKTHNACSI